MVYNKIAENRVKLKMNIWVKLWLLNCASAQENEYKSYFNINKYRNLIYVLNMILIL